MKFSSVIVALVLASFPCRPTTAFGQGTKDVSEDVMIRARIEPEGEVYVGQKVILSVDVLTSSWFTSAPRYPELRLGDAVVLTPEGSSVNFTDRINGQTWAGQTRSYYVYPQKAGRYTIPSLTVVVNYALPDRSSSDDIEISSPELTFSARIPEEAEGLAFATTSRFTVEEETDPDTASFRVGDTFTRTITMEAEDTAGMMIPPLRFDEIEGFALYPADPTVADESYRGTFRGKRIESVTYVLEKEGEYVLPEIALHWWDIKNEEMKQEVLPAIEMSVEPNPDLDPELLASLGRDAGAEAEEKVGFLPGATARRLWAFLLICAVVGAALLLLWRKYGSRILQWGAAWLGRRRESEAAYFRRFRKASMKDDPKETFRRLMLWLDHLEEPDAPRSMEALARESGNPELQREAASLNALLFGRTEAARDVKWSAKRFFRLVCRARNSLQRRRKAAGRLHRLLPPLNP
jgi:hypothetical protein